MDLTSRVLVVLGCVAGAVTGAMAVAAVLLVAGLPTDAIVSQLLMGVAAAGAAVVGARANIASGRLLLVERAADPA
jgi:hypothetical protein